MFNTVYIDLDAEEESAADETKGDENNAEVDELQTEWEEVYRELTSLLSCEEVQTNDSSGGNHSIDADDFQGNQDMRDICATIDLTQSPVTATKRKKSSSGFSSDESDDGPELLKSTDVNVDELHNQKQARIQQLLNRMHQIHTTLMDLAPSSKSQLKSKFLSLKRSNADLQSQIDILNGEKNAIQSKLNRANQSLFDRNIETEREKRLHQERNDEYTHLLEVHATYQNKCKIEIDSLKLSNARLKKECDQLRTVSGLKDVQEMEEITEKYRKMSQQLHDVKNENRVLKRRIEERERRRGEMDRIRNEVRSMGGSVDDGSASLKIAGKENARRVSDEHASVDSDKAPVNQRSNKSGTSKALDILNSAPSRKSVQKKSNTSQKRGISRSNSHALKRNQVRDIGRWDDEEDESDTEEPFDVQLFMKPNNAKKQCRGNIRPTGTNNHVQNYPQNKPASSPISYQRSESISSVSNVTGTQRMLKQSASLSRKSMKNGQISSFFKPAAR